MNKQKTGVELIAEERQEQIVKHNRTIAHDRENNPNYELMQGAKFCLTGTGYPEKWNPGYETKILMKPLKERLVCAGALIAAEIDRLNSIQ